MRLTRKLTDVIEEVRIILQTDFDITTEKLKALRERVEKNGHDYPIGTNFIPFSEQWLDYEVQRAAIPQHILNIMRNYDRMSGCMNECTDGHMDKCTRSNLDG